MSEKVSSLWKEALQSSRYPALDRDLSVDVLIIGAGITGLTLAKRLVDAGLEVCVLERHHLAHGTTGHTSAHLTNQWDPGYSEVIKKHDEKTAKLVYSAMTEAIRYIEEQSQQMEGGADFRYLDAYYYRENESQEEAIQDEAAALEKLGIPFAKVTQAPLPFGVMEGIQISKQAVFQPVQYLQGLVRNMDSPRFRLFENSPVIDISGDTAKTPGGQVKARSIVHATHTPLGISPVQAAMVATRSYVIAGKSNLDVPDALYWDTASPYHYIRKFSHQGEELLVIGGGDKQVGSQDETQGLEEIKAYARERFGVQEIRHQWSAQFYEPSDSLPIIGKSSTDSQSYIATGFSGDGLTFGTASALLISDLILGRANELEQVFSPSRLSYLTKEFAKHNLEVAKDMVKDRVVGDGISADELEKGKGCVLPSVSGPKAYYRGEDGELFEMSAVCSHMKCVVHWNDLQRSFDCPCHGSRYSTGGEVLEGPAYSGLSDRKLVKAGEEIKASPARSEQHRTQGHPG